jgi:hypothetical protein
MYVVAVVKLVVVAIGAGFVVVLVFVSLYAVVCECVLDHAMGAVVVVMVVCICSFAGDFVGVGLCVEMSPVVVVVVVVFVVDVVEVVAVSVPIVRVFVWLMRQFVCRLTVDVELVGFVLVVSMCLENCGVVVVVSVTV